jgi:serine/threonine protein kinase
MAPEQISHPSEVDHRADIYALGVVFYQMLTGELPGKRLEAPSKKVQIDVRLDEIVLRAMEKEPEMRYQTAHEFRTVVDGVQAPAHVLPPSLSQLPPKRGMLQPYITPGFLTPLAQWLLPVIVLCCLPFMIRGYVITEDAILIRRLFWTTRLDRGGLKSAQVIPKAMSKSLRTCGNGGGFSFIGWYWNKPLGF